MIKLSKMADYAVIVLDSLGAHKNQRMTGEKIVEHTQLPLPTVRKILRLLLAAELIKSTPGARGGYCTTRPLEEISLLAVLKSIDGEWALTACSVEDHLSSCTYSSACKLKHSWFTVNGWIMQMLAGVTVADMSKDLQLHAFNRWLQASSFTIVKV